MECEQVREALSARLDGEAVPAEGALVDAHVVGCAGCASFRDGAARLHRATRVRAAEPVPDLSAPIMARAAGAPGRPAPPEREWARYVLLAVALVELVSALPGLVLGGDGGDAAHLTRELGGWNLALGVAWLAVAWAPHRAAGLLPFAAALAVMTAVTAVLDVSAGRAPAGGEAHHALDLVGVAMLALLARRGPAATSLLPRRA